MQEEKNDKNITGDTKETTMQTDQPTAEVKSQETVEITEVAKTDSGITGQVTQEVTGTAVATEEIVETKAYARSLADENKPELPRQTQLNAKEINSLKHHNYIEAAKKFNQSFVVLNKKTGMVVEMRAATSTHACTMIGWRHKNCKILKVIKHEVGTIDAQEAARNEAEIEIVEKKTSPSNEIPFTETGSRKPTK